MDAATRYENAALLSLSDCLNLMGVSGCKISNNNFNDYSSESLDVELIKYAIEDVV